MEPSYNVEIVNIKSGEVSRTMGPYTKRFAEKACRGALINLDHTRFDVRVVPCDELGDPYSDLP